MLTSAALLGFTVLVDARRGRRRPLGVVVLGIMAAYVIARYNFRGRRRSTRFFTAGLHVPASRSRRCRSASCCATSGCTARSSGVIIPQVAFALPTTIIILVPFLRAIPHELEEAAAIDGASRIGFFWRILLPLSTPGLVTVGVLAFIGSWNAYLLPLLVMAPAACRRSSGRCRSAFSSSRRSTRRTPAPCSRTPRSR